MSSFYSTVVGICIYCDSTTGWVSMVRRYGTTVVLTRAMVVDDVGSRAARLTPSACRRGTAALAASARHASHHGAVALRRSTGAAPVEILRARPWRRAAAARASRWSFPCICPDRGGQCVIRGHAPPRHDRARCKHGLEDNTKSCTTMATWQVQLSL